MGFLTMLIGYCRVSTFEQNTDLQIDALKLAGCERIYQDKVSGAKKDRPELAKALEHARRGDALVVWRLDRLGRSLKHLIEVVEQLEEREIGFKSIQESIDTTTTGGRLVFHIFGALAEFERGLIQERVQAGLAAARARGRKGGRPRALRPDQAKLLYKLADEKEKTVVEICRLLEISRPTYYDYLNRRKEYEKAGK